MRCACDAVLHGLRAAGSRLVLEEIGIGKAVIISCGGRPASLPKTLCTDQWRSRLLVRLVQAGVDIVEIEGPHRLAVEPGCSLGQGQ